MSSSCVLLANLKAGRCSNKAEVRLLRFWEARNFKKGGQLMSLDMLLLDSESTLIQGTINATREETFRPDLREGFLYKLSGFDVGRSNPKFRMSDSPVSIRFNDGTVFESTTETEKDIARELFRFRHHEDFLALANTNKELPDVIGELLSIRSTLTDGTLGMQRVMVTIRIDGGSNVCVSMFDNQAYAFQEKFDTYHREPKVIVFTSINPKVVSGKLFLNATSGTHIYFDNETTAGKEQYELLGGGGGNENPSSKLLPAQKIEPLTVAELNQFVLTSDPQIIEFLCKAEVTSVQADKGWCYIGCSKCAKKLHREFSSFTCLFCDKTDALAALRYRVELCVKDQTDEAVFVAFDTETAKLTNIQASEAAHILGIGENARVDTDFPEFLNEIVGKTYMFQLKLGAFNFTSRHQSFTVSRIISEHERAPLAAFVNEGEGHDAEAVEDSGNTASTIGPDTAGGTTVIDKPSTAGAAAVKCTASDKQEHVDGSKVKKRARHE